MSDKLTIKQEAFCQAYVKTGFLTAAYKEVYQTKNMKSETIHETACKLAANPKITTRIAELQEEAKKRNDVSIDEVIQSLASMLRFDISVLFDENGKLKDIHSIPIEARLMIHQIDIDEITRKGTVVGLSKKVRTYSKVDAIEKLMRHLGGYEKDNSQIKPEVKIINLGSGIKPDETNN